MQNTTNTFTKMFAPGQRVTLRDYYESADKDEKPGYIGTFRKMLIDGYAVVEWDEGFTTEEWVGFREQAGYDDSDLRFADEVTQ